MTKRVMPMAHPKSFGAKPMPFATPKPSKVVKKGK